jgi:hypothetical protein
MLRVSIEHALQRKGTRDVSMDNEERLGISSKNFITEVIDASSGTKSLIFTKIAVVDQRKLYIRADRRQTRAHVKLRHAAIMPETPTER